MTFRPCGNTGSVHRLFLKEEPDENRHSIGTVCPHCAIDLRVHSEAGSKEGLQLAVQTDALLAHRNKLIARTSVASATRPAALKVSAVGFLASMLLLGSLPPNGPVLGGAK
jgi:hypothetical protein